MRLMVTIWTAQLRTPEKRGHTDHQSPGIVQGEQGCDLDSLLVLGNRGTGVTQVLLGNISCEQF